MEEIFSSRYKVPVFVISNDKEYGISVENSYVINNEKKEHPTAFALQVSWENRASKALGGYIVVDRYHDSGRQTISLFLRGETIYESEIGDDVGTQILDLYYLITRINEDAVPVYKDGEYIGAAVDIPGVFLKNSHFKTDNEIRIDVETGNSVVARISRKEDGKLLSMTEAEHIYWSDLNKILRNWKVAQAEFQVTASEVPFVKITNKNIEVCGLDINTRAIRHIENFPPYYLEAIKANISKGLFCSIKELPLSGKAVSTTTAVIGNEIVEVESDTVQGKSVDDSDKLLNCVLTLLEMADKYEINVTGTYKSQAKMLIEKEEVDSIEAS